MKKLLCLSLFSICFWLASYQPAYAQRRTPTPSPSLPVTATQSATASADLIATTSAIASPSATTEQKIQDKKDSDLTESSGKQKDKLVSYLESQPLAPLSWSNPLQHLIRRAISQGLPANIIVLLIVFPIIATIIATSRHLIGLQGFGIYIPAVLSVAFVSTGLTTGVMIFAVVLIAVSVIRMVLKRLKLQYLPRTALLLWGVSLSVLLVLLATAIFGLSWFLTVNIFPILIIILLTENFMETQLTTSQSQAIQMTFETLLTAVLCSLIISWEPIQKFVLLRPELTFIVVAIFNMLVGRYSGLRLLEYVRFRSILES